MRYLRVFGCKVYAKVTKPHLKKLDDRSRELVYLGTQPGSKAYRLFDPVTKDMVVSRDVKFKEDEGWDWKEVQSDELLLLEEPKNYKEAAQDKKWIEVMQIETDSINKNKTWKLATLQDNQKAIERFEMSDLGLLAYYLGIEVTKTEDGISIKQTGYANKILKEARMVDCNKTKISMDPGTKLIKTEGELVDAMEYRSLIGCLRYLLHTRPDLSYSVGLLSWFMQEPREQHMKAIRQLLRYIKGTLNFGINYYKKADCKLLGYSDSSYGINIERGKGTTGIVFYFGNSPIS
nr:ribonuclease H-like domain, reverse transcriptase, RNA-dependent DNA polymerase [Tanacetum cinerariifolium]